MLGRKPYTFSENGKIYRAVPDSEGYHIEEYAPTDPVGYLTEQPRQPGC